ncbi:MAG: carboxyl-terminal protease [Flavipsychrobacter sp.]|jgi:carboxyl-terminal processing protease|nr:carboxyl-terminal protease [Flavipsychrobacter sp.]
MLRFMKNKILIPLLILGCIGAFLSFKYRGKGRSSDEKRKLVLEAVMKTINQVHFSPRNVDDSFSSRVYHKMVHDFDYEKLFFTQQDINKLKVYEFKIDDEIRDNSIEFFDTLDAIWLRKIDMAEKYYPDMLGKPFSFNTNEEIQVNSDKEPYAANEKELSERWRLFLKYRVLEKYVSLKDDQDKKKANKDSVNAKFKSDAELEAQAREDVKRFYKRVFTRYHKWKDDERFTLYVNAISEMEDPHTNYFPPEEKKAFDVNMSGSFFGIGAKLSPANDKITVSEIITGSPSWKQGELKAGDEIIMVAQGEKAAVDVQGMDLDDAIKLIRGPKGTEVRLTVKRPDGSTKVIGIKRDVIQIEETFAKSAIIKGKEGPIGYIYLPEFYADFNHTSGRNCSDDIAAEVQKLKKEGVTGIILDLRGNGGGSLGDVVDIASLFVGKGPVVQVKSNRAAPTVLRTRSDDTIMYTGPLAIMVNGGSASASEILAAALQDYKRAVIVGSLTFGKGTVQKMVDLDQMIDPMTKMMLRNDTDGAMGTSIGSIKMTMEKFYRVNGGSTQLRGVKPDVTIPDDYDRYDEEDLGERHRKSALPWDEIPAANYKPTNSIGNLKQVTMLSESRIQSNPVFKQVQENTTYYKRKKEDNRVSLNEAKYRKEMEEITSRTKKLEEILKNNEVLEMTNLNADMQRITLDSASIAKNKDWLKALSKDNYIAETVNILNDLPRSGVSVNMDNKMR